MFTPTGWVPNGQQPLDQMTTTSYTPTNALAGLGRQRGGGRNPEEDELARMRGHNNIGRPMDPRGQNRMPMMGNDMQMMGSMGRPDNPNALAAWSPPTGWPGDWRNQMMDWRAQRPQFAPGDGMPGDFRAQFQDWRAQRPDFRSYFQGV